MVALMSVFIGFVSIVGISSLNVKAEKNIVTKEEEEVPLLQKEPLERQYVQMALPSIYSYSAEDTEYESPVVEPMTEEITSEVVEETTETQVTELQPEPEVSEEKVMEEVVPNTISQTSEDDVYLLAQIIFCETGTATYEDMIYVGSVVLNRIRTNYKDFANVHTVAEVLYQNRGTKIQQYANPTINKVESGIVPPQECIDVATGLINGTIECLEESVLYQTGFVPKWNVEVVNLPNAEHYYSRPLDF